MSKAFACKTIRSDRVVVETTDGVQSVVIDQAFGVAISASGAGKAMTVTASNDASALIASDGGEIAIRNTATPMGITLDPTTNTVALTTTERIVSTSADFVMLATNQIAGQADSNVLFSQLRLRDNATLDPAAASYASLTRVELPDLFNSPRLNVAPDAAAGTSIHSLFLDSPGVANPAGWVMLVQNIGTAPAQTLTLVNQSGSGADGGLFFGPGDFVIPAGGGVVIMFDTHVTADGAWLVYGV